MGIKSRVFSTSFVLSVAIAIILFSCRKADLSSPGISDKSAESVESKFFSMAKPAGQTENVLINYLIRLNNEKHFVERTVEKIGYPRWDKIMKVNLASQASLAKGVNSTNIKAVNSNNGYELYYVPFVRDSQNYVNAAMVIKTGVTDTTIAYMCDWQYRQLPNDINKPDDAAEHFAMRLMILDNLVFGHTEFKITDANLFRKDKGQPLQLRFNKKASTGNVQANLFGLPEDCEDVTVRYQYCWYIATQGHCYGPGGECDYYYCTEHDRCQGPVDATYTFCWDDWGSYGGGGYGGGSGSGGSGGSGGGTGGDPVPPDPCQQPGGNSVREPKGQTAGGVRVNFGCNGNPGWAPVDPSLIWVFAGDDGTWFSDPDPAREADLQFDPNDHIDTKYPNLYQLVKNLKEFVKSSPEVLAALTYWSGFSKQAVLDNLTFGKGPTVKVIEINDSFASYNKATGEKILNLSASWVRGLEKAALPATKQGTAFLLAVSLLHEFVHYGTGQNNISEGKNFDFGWGFERSAFNVRVTEVNANEISIRFRKLP